MEHTVWNMLSFLIDKERFAIPLDEVVRCVRAVAVTPVPDNLDMIHGVINYHGEIIPVINLRKRFSMKEKPLSVEDCFLIVAGTTGKLALVVDRFENVVNVSREKLKKPALFRKNDSPYLLQTDDGIVVICDITMLLTSNLSIQLQSLKEMRM